MVVGNIFALRSTDPLALYRSMDPLGPDNDRILKEIQEEVNRLVIGWGNQAICLDDVFLVCHYVS